MDNFLYSVSKIMGADMALIARINRILKTNLNDASYPYSQLTSEIREVLAYIKELAIAADASARRAKLNHQAALIQLNKCPDRLREAHIKNADKYEQDFERHNSELADWKSKIAELRAKLAEIQKIKQPPIQPIQFQNIDTGGSEIIDIEEELMLMKAALLAPNNTSVEQEAENLKQMVNQQILIVEQELKTLKIMLDKQILIVEQELGFLRKIFND